MRGIYTCDCINNKLKRESDSLFLFITNNLGLKNKKKIKKNEKNKQKIVDNKQN